MKKIKKLFLAVALILFSSLAMPVLSQVVNVAEAATPFEYLSVEGFVDEVNVGEEYTIAEAKVLDESGDTGKFANIKVKDPVGKQVVSIEYDASNQTDDSKKFIASKYGTYKVVYEYGSNSQELTFVAKEGKYELEFNDNSKQIIAKTINVSDYDGKVVLPMPIVKDSEGEEIANANIVVSVLDPSNTALVSPEVVMNEQGFYEVALSEEKLGNYIVSYMYQVSGRVLASTTIEFTTDTTFNNNYKITPSYNSSKPSTAITGVETTLPTITAKNETTGDEVEIYYEIKAIKLTYGETTTETDVTAQVIDGNKFTPNVDGDYRIKYVISNFFGTSTSLEFLIEDVKDTQKPVVRLVSPYETTPADDDNQLKQMPNKHDLKNLVLPAIWANDNVAKTLADFKFTRKLLKSNGDVVFELTTDANKEIVFNYVESAGFVFDEDTQVKVSANEEITLTTGTYEIVYSAEDKAGIRSESNAYSIYLETNFTDTSMPEISWSNVDLFPDVLYVGEELSFLAPTATDKDDSRLEVTVEYLYVGGTGLPSDYTEIELEDNSYKINEVANATQLKIRATAKDSANNETEIEETIDIVDADSRDTASIKVFDVQNMTGTIQQGDTVQLPTVKFKDDYGDFTQIGIVVKNSEGKEVSVTNQAIDVEKISNSEYNITVKDAVVYASYSGDYSVSYIAKDLKNNYAIYFTSFNASSYVEPTEIGFAETLKLENELELGETLSLPKAEIDAPEGYVASYVVKMISAPSSTSTKLTNTVFKPGAVGEYVLRYYGTYTQTSIGDVHSEHPTKEFTVTVKDTTAPVINYGYVEPRYALDTVFTIPEFSAYDLSAINMEKSNVSISVTVNKRDSENSATSKTIDYDDYENSREFTLAYNGIYTLKFTAYDIYGNVSTETKTFQVGDTTAPQISFDEKLIPSEVKVGDELSIDLALITLTDDKDEEIDKDDLEITLTRTNDDGTSTDITNMLADSTTKQYKFKIDQTGTYKLTLKVQDSATNEAVESTTFTVQAKTNDGVETNEIIGGILLAVSILLLAGVIVYFIVSNKKIKKMK